MPHKILYSILLLLLLIFASCSNTKYLPAGDSLYIGSKVSIKDKEADKKERKVLITQLKGSVRPKPNTKVAGMRLKLAIYNRSGIPKKKKGIRAWLHNKIGEPPVLGSTVNIAKDNAIMQNVLQNNGFFKAVVSGSAIVKHKKTELHFDVSTGAQFIINKVVLEKDSEQIYLDIDSDFSHTLLVPGAPYNLDLIKAERTRIENGLKEKGYYYFNSSYLLVQVDTNLGNNKIDMYVRLKGDSVPDEAYNVYRIKDMFVFPYYNLRGKASDTDKNNAVLYEGMRIIDTRKLFKPELFSKAILFEVGDVYSASDQNRSISRLVNLNTFKFVKNRFEPEGDTALDVYYYLTPFPKKSIRFEIGALTQNDNRVGSEGSISWHNRNTFKGAEEFIFKINGGFEKQYSTIIDQPNIYNFGAEAALSIPRFAVPFIDVQTYNQFMPKTLIKLSYNYESESTLLRINSYKFSYGYDWKRNTHTEHQFYPFNFIYVKTDTLGNANKLNLLYGNLIFNGIIIGPTYEFTCNTLSDVQKKNNFYFDGLADLSGNILGLAQHADHKTNPQTIFGSNYAQYIKLQTDFRYYRRFSKTLLLANRLLIDAGFPYGNSSQLPNIKQFWAGGNSDLRGFPSRLVGPGTFNEYTLYQSSTYLETLGDIKLEFNTELRENITKIFGLALFIDAGNIWLYNSNPAFPGGVFNSNFYKDIAVDAGVGFRFNFDIFIIRLDIGMPVYEPWLPQDERLVLNKINIEDPSWKTHNLVYNIGIGYPF